MIIDKKTAAANSLLFVTAAIWGFAFVAQRAGMAHVGPFTFNGVRFALGTASLIPLLIWSERRQLRPTLDGSKAFWGCITAGMALFCGASLQQVGLVYTTAGKAGFITGLYVVIVPIVGVALSMRTDAGTWMGALLATVGMYLLSVTDRFTIELGDLLVLAGAFFWAMHVHVIGWLSPRMNPIKIAFVQFGTCSLLSLFTAVMVETMSLAGIRAAALPILYGGLMSVGIAYTLQVVAQKHATPAPAAIILSLEAVFAALGGWWLLGEMLSMRALAGCLLMLVGMLISQLWGIYVSRRMKRSALSSEDAAPPQATQLGRPKP
jgi:drug/metabolite transporter (DMT)-like permease